MAVFTLSINELPSIIFNLFDFKLIKNAIKEYCENLTINYFSCPQFQGVPGQSGNPQDAPGTAGNPQGIQHQSAVLPENIPNEVGITPSEYKQLVGLIDNDIISYRRSRDRFINYYTLTFGDIGYNGKYLTDNSLFSKIYTKHP